MVLKSDLIDRITLKQIAVAAFLITLITALWNIGFIAVDDYYHGIVQYIPAQKSSFSVIIEKSGIRSPIPNMILLSLSKAAYFLGIESPAGQLRFINVILGLVAQITFFASVGHFVRRSSREIKIAALLAGFYFTNPMFFTRPLIEAMSAPWLILSSFLLCRYFNDERPRARDLSFAIVTVTLAAFFRFQSGICALVIPIFVLWRRQWSHLLVGAVVGAICFWGTGSIDTTLKGQFYASLRGYLDFNLQHSSIFGTTPFYSYFLLFIGLSLPPALFMRFRGLDWRGSYRPLLPALAYFLIFVLAHSFVPHKEERFMIPILPIFVVLLVPLLHFLWSTAKNSWRLKYFIGLNGLLLLLVSFNTVQRNTIALAQHMDRDSRVKVLIGAGDTLGVFPRALILRDDFATESMDPQAAVARGLTDCSEQLAVRYDFIEGLKPYLDGLDKVADFQPGLPEQVVVKLNPRKNGRRGAIALFKKPEC